MGKFSAALSFVGLLLVHSAVAQSTASTYYCAGAEGNSKACALGCSGTRINDDVTNGGNQGTFDVGNGNQGDGNDGFNNAGNFNIGSGNTGNCNIQSGGTGGICDPSNNAGQIVLRFCHVYPSNNRCNPGGYLPEFSPSLTSQLPAIVASCSGVTAPPAALRSPPPPSTIAPTPRTAPGPIVPVPVTPIRPSFPLVSDSTADLSTLLALFDEHIAQDKFGRKLKL